MERNVFFESANIRRLFFKIAITGSIGMLASAIYQVIDGMFVNLFLGSTAFSAVNFVFPLVVVSYAIADLIGVGSSVIIAIRLGEKRQKEANSIFSTALIFILGVDIVLALVFLFASEPLLVMMGAEGELLEMSKQYLQVYLISLPLTGFTFALDNYLRIAGLIKTSMTINLLMSIGVISVEYLFLGVLKMPVYGAALAACLCFSVAAIVSFIPFFFKKTNLHFGRPSFHLSYQLAVLRNGLPTFLSNIAGRVTAIIFNIILLEQGGEDAVSAYGVLMYIDGFIQPILYGMCDSLQPCIGYNYGAKKYDRVKKIEKLCFMSSALICLLAFIILISMPQYISSIFTSNGSGSLKEMATYATFIFSFMYLSRWISYNSQSFFSAIEKPLPSILISLSVSLIFPLLLVPILLSIKLTGMWLNPVLSALCAALVASFFLYFYIKKRGVLKGENLIEEN